VQAESLSLDENCKKLEETIQRVATNTIGYTRKQANKEWFDEECAKGNEEKNAARERAIQTKTRGAKISEKAAGADSIAAELLKNGEPYLMDALHEVIQ
jgi:hypothetical protein